MSAPDGSPWLEPGDHAVVSRDGHALVITALDGPGFPTFKINCVSCARLVAEHAYACDAAIAAHLQAHTRDVAQWNRTAQQRQILTRYLAMLGLTPSRGPGSLAVEMLSLWSRTDELVDERVREARNMLEQP